MGPFTILWITAGQVGTTATTFTGLILLLRVTIFLIQLKNQVIGKKNDT